jgi:hypothetical protein
VTRTSHVLAQVASYLDATGWPRRAPDLPLWTSDRVLTIGSQAELLILKALLTSESTAFLRSRSSPLDDPALARLDWVLVGPNTWKVPQALDATAFLPSGFSADQPFRLTLHRHVVPDFDFGDDLWEANVGPLLERLRSHSVLAVFVSAPHLGWALALPFIGLESAV